jgi:hypothetical protein
MGGRVALVKTGAGTLTPGGIQFSDFAFNAVGLAGTNQILLYIARVLLDARRPIG